MSDKLFTVGKIVNTHGIRGEIKIWPQTDFPDIRFRKGSRLVLFQPEGAARMSVEIEAARQHKNVYIVKLKGLDSIDDVEKYKGWMLKVTEDQLVDLPDDQYYYHEIIGCHVVTDQGEELGTITDILTTGANDVWVVERPKRKPVLIPVIDDVLLGVDVPNKQVRIHLMEGML